MILTALFWNFVSNQSDRTGMLLLIVAIHLRSTVGVPLPHTTPWLGGAFVPATEMLDRATPSSDLVHDLPIQQSYTMLVARFVMGIAEDRNELRRGRRSNAIALIGSDMKSQVHAMGEFGPLVPPASVPNALHG